MSKFKKGDLVLINIQEKPDQGIYDGMMELDFKLGVIESPSHSNRYMYVEPDYYAWKLCNLVLIDKNFSK